LIFALWALLIYSNTLNASFHFDDEHVFAKLSLEEILNKCTFRGGGTRMVAELSFAFNYWLSGTSVLSYHVFNILVHTGTAYLFYVFLSLVLYQFTTQGPIPVFEGKPDNKQSIRFPKRDQNAASGTWHLACWPALLGSALFLVHPFATQAVTYVTQRYTSLAAFFYIGSLAAFVKARIMLREDGRFFAPVHIFWYITAFLLAVFAMLTKEISITLPVAILMTEFFFLKPDFLALRKRILYILPLMVTVVIIPAVRILGGQIPSAQYVDALTTWAPAVERSAYFLTQLKVIVGTYLKLMIFPIGQNIDHSFVVAENLFETPVLASFLFSGALFCAGLWLFKRSRLASFGIFWFFVTIVPTSSIVPNVEFVAEHRAYISLMGLGFIVAGLPGWNNRWKWYVSVLLPALLLVSGLTYWRNKVWQTPITLWADASQKSPERSRPLINYGRALREAGRLDEAVTVYQRALSVPPEPWREGKDHYIACNNLGNVYLDQERYQEALESFKRASQIRPESPTVLYNLGRAYEKVGAWEEAVRTYKKLLSTKHLFPHLLFPDILFNLSEIYYAHGQLARSEESLRRAIEIRPDFAEAYFNLADIHLARGDNSQAVRLYDKVLSLKPGFAEAYYNKGNALVGLGRLDDAEENYRKAISLKPGAPSFHNNLGNILMLKKNYSEAAKAYQVALSYNSDFGSAHLNLGIIYFRHLKQNQRAVFHFKRFLGLSPDDSRHAEVEAMLEEIYGK